MPSFASSTPGSPSDLPFTVAEFIAACTLARNGQDSTAPEDWQKLMTMYTQIKLLRIDPTNYFSPHIVAVPSSGLTLINSPLYNLFLSELSAPPPSYPFGLPFSLSEFVEAVQLSHDSTLVSNFRFGIRERVSNMIHDLAIHHIDIRSFITGDESTSLADWVAQSCPPSLLNSVILLMLLQCTAPSSPHTFNLNAFTDRMNVAHGVLPSVRDPRNQSVAVQPMSHLQAAVFVSGLKKAEVDREYACVWWDFKDEHLDKWIREHAGAEELVEVPCCGQRWMAGFLRRYLMGNKAFCRECGEGWL